MSGRVERKALSTIDFESAEADMGITMNRKPDIIFIFMILTAAAVIWLVLSFVPPPAGGTISVTIDGQAYGRYDLREAGPERTIALPGAGGGYNLLVISERGASVREADCPDRLCVGQRAVSRQGECIICLPHKLVIRVEGGQEGAPDGITY
jgi:hypothetical protein